MQFCNWIIDNQLIDYLLCELVFDFWIISFGYQISNEFIIKWLINH